MEVRVVIIEILIVFIKYLITGILPILAILLTWLTLREMQIQRRQSYIPDIMVKNCYKYMIVDKISDNIYFSDNKENEVENIEDIPKGFELNILNIGMGTAKNVNVNFEILTSSRTLPSKHTSTLSQPLNPQTANELTKMPRHERVNLSTRT